jgi:subtilisin-like proprotein convertase family protein
MNGALVKVQIESDIMKKRINCLEVVLIPPLIILTMTIKENETDKQAYARRSAPCWLLI